MKTRPVRSGRPRTWAAVVIVVVGLAPSPDAIGQQSKATGTAPMARYFPRQDLVVYLEFDGLDAHRAAWTRSAAYRLLNETTTGAMLEQSAAHFLDLVMSRGSRVPANGRELLAMGLQLARSGFAIGINRAGGAGLPRCLGLVIRGGAAGAARATLDRFLKLGEGAKSSVKVVEKPGGRKVHVRDLAPGKPMAWWAEGDDLVVSLVSASGVDAIVSAIDGREPNAVDHPTRQALIRGDDAPGFEPVGLAFFDMAALPPLPREGVALGLDRIERFDFRWGFHGAAIQSILGAVVPSPRTGIPALFDQPTFDAKHLPPLPGGLSGFTVVSLDPSRVYDQLAAVMKVVDPRASQALGPIDVAVKQFSGLNLRDDILAHLGSRIVLYTVPTRIIAPPNVPAGLVHALAFAPRSSVVIDVKDPKAIARVLEVVAEKSSKPVPASPNQGSTTSFSLNTMHRLKGPEVGYIFRPSKSSLTLPMGMRQTVLVGRKAMVLGMSPTTARRARDLSEREGALGLPTGDPLLSALDGLPGRWTFLNVVDDRQSILADLLVGVPNLIDSLPTWEVLLSSVAPFVGESSVTVVEDSIQEIEAASTAPAAPSIPGTEKPAAVREKERAPAFDPELIPEPDELRPFLLPRVMVLVVDDRGIRFIARAAF